VFRYKPVVSGASSTIVTGTVVVPSIDKSSVVTLDKKPVMFDDFEYE